jgi:hypothetical protein
VHRDTNGARLIGDRARDGLADPPRRVGRELVAAAIFELIDGLHQADVAFLDQVQELQATVRVLLRDRHDQAQIGFDQLCLGALGSALSAVQALVGLTQDIGGLRHILFDLGNRLTRFLDRLKGRAHLR